MATVEEPWASIDDLYRTPEKAELIGGRIVHLMPTGVRPSEVAANIYVSLREHTRKTGRGKAYTDNLGYAVPELPSGRESFSPDASCYAGALPENPMRFIEGPPTFAVEVRSENDYDESAFEEMADNRDDYFAAGTAVVWDVDSLNELIFVYRPPNGSSPTIFGRGQVADAEPAVPAWRIAVDDIFSS